MIEHLDGIFERVTFRENLGFRINYLNVYENFPDHWHTPIEMVRASRNWYEVHVNGCTYRLQEGDIAVILPGTIHALCAPCEGSRTIYLADISFLKEISSFETLLALLPPVTVLSPHTNAELHAKVSGLLSFIEKEYEKSSSFFDLFIYSSLIDLLGCLGRFDAAVYTLEHIGAGSAPRYTERLLSTCNYINEHCTENLTLDQVSEMAGFSKYHFTRLFKEFTRISFYQYLSQKRIALAEQLLANPDYSVTDVALNSGFSSLPAFTRMFRQHKGCTPTEFRNMYSSDCMHALQFPVS